jgi:mono/diheme cytochrome c family protein
MIRRWIGLLSLGLVVVVAGVAAQQAPPQPAPKPAGNGWQLPSDAEDTKNPLTVDAKLLDAGKGVFKNKCERCHGPGGLGDGKDAEPEHQEDMDLTNPRRAARNSDGIVFYKVMNGRKQPKMPAFKEELTKDQVWSVVAYVQTLRRK